MKLRLLADYWQQRKKDADGVMFYVQRRNGDEFEVSEAEARALLRTGDYIRPMAEKVETTEQKSTQSASAKPATSGNK